VAVVPPAAAVAGIPPTPPPTEAQAYQALLEQQRTELEAIAPENRTPEQSARLAQIVEGLRVLGTGPVDFTQPLATVAPQAEGMSQQPPAKLVSVTDTVVAPPTTRRAPTEQEFDALHNRYIARNANQVDMLADNFDAVEAWASGRTALPPGRWNAAQWMDLASGLESMATAAAAQDLNLDQLDNLAQQIRTKARSLPGAASVDAPLDVRSLGAEMVPTQNDRWQMPVKTLEKFFRTNLNIDLRTRPGLSGALSRALNLWANGDGTTPALDAGYEAETQRLINVALTPDAVFTAEPVVQLNVADRSNDQSIVDAIIAEYVNGDLAVLPSRSLVNQLFVRTRPAATGDSQAPGVNWGSAYGKEIYQKLEDVYYARFPQDTTPVARWTSGAKGAHRVAEIPLIHVPASNTRTDTPAVVPAQSDAAELRRLEATIAAQEMRLAGIRDPQQRVRESTALTESRQRRTQLQAALTSWLSAKQRADNGDERMQALIAATGDLSSSDFAAVLRAADAPAPSRKGVGRAAAVDAAMVARQKQIDGMDKDLAKLVSRQQAMLSDPDYARYQAMERQEMDTSAEGKRLRKKFQGSRGFNGVEARIRQARSALFGLRQEQETDRQKLAALTPTLSEGSMIGLARALRLMPASTTAPARMYAVVPHTTARHFQREQVLLETSMLVTTLPLAKQIAGDTGTVVEVGNTEVRSLAFGGDARYVVPSGYYKVGEADATGVVQLTRQPERGSFAVEGKFTNNPDTTAQQVSMGIEVRVPEALRDKVNPNIRWDRNTGKVTDVTLVSPEFRGAVVSEPGDYQAVWEARDTHAAARNSQLARRTLDERQHGTTLEEDRANLVRFFNSMMAEGVPTEQHVQAYHNMVEALRRRETGLVMPAEERMDYLDGLPPAPQEGEALQGWSAVRWDQVVDNALRDSDLTRAFVGDQNRLIRAAQQRYLKKLRLGVTKLPSPQQAMRDVVQAWHKALVNHGGPQVLSLQQPVGTDLGGAENTLETHLASVARDFDFDPEANPLTSAEHDEFMQVINSGRGNVTADMHEQVAYARTVKTLVESYPAQVRRILAASKGNAEFAIDPFNGMIVWVRGETVDAGTEQRLASALGTYAQVSGVMDRLLTDPDLTLALISMHEGMVDFLAQKGITPADTTLPALANLVNQDNRHWELLDLVESYRDTARAYMQRQRQDFLDQHADEIAAGNRAELLAPAVRSSASLDNLTQELRALERQAKAEGFADRGTTRRMNDVRALMTRRMRTAMAQAPSLQAWLNNEGSPVRQAIRAIFAQNGVAFTPDATNIQFAAQQSVLQQEAREAKAAADKASREKAQTRTDEIIQRLRATAPAGDEGSPFVTEWKESFASQLIDLGLDQEGSTVAGAISRIATSSKYPQRLRTLAKVLDQPGFASLLTDLRLQVDYQPDVALPFYTVMAPHSDSETYYQRRGALVLNGAAMNSDVATNLLDHLVQTTVSQRLAAPVTDEQKASVQRINDVMAEIRGLENRTRLPDTPQRWEQALASPQEFVRNLWSSPEFLRFVNSLETPSSAMVRKLRDELDHVVEQLDPDELRDKQRAIKARIAELEAAAKPGREQLATMKEADTTARTAYDKETAQLDADLASARERLEKAATKDDRLAEREIVKELESKIKKRKPLPASPMLARAQSMFDAAESELAEARAALLPGGSYHQEVQELRDKRDTLYQRIQDEQAAVESDLDAGRTRRAAGTQGILSRIWKYLAELFTGTPVAFGSMLHEAFDAMGGLLTNGNLGGESFLGRLQGLLADIELVPPMKVMDARQQGRRAMRTRANEMAQDPGTDPQAVQDLERRINADGFNRVSLARRAPAPRADTRMVADLENVLRTTFAGRVRISIEFDDPAWVNTDPDNKLVFVNPVAMAAEMERIPVAGRLAFLVKAIEEEEDHNELMTRFSEAHLLAVAEGMTAAQRRELMTGYLGLDPAAMTEDDETRLSYVTGDHPQMSDDARVAARLNLAHEHLRQLRQLGRTGMTTEQARAYVSRLEPGQAVIRSALASTMRKATHRFRTFGDPDAMLADAKSQEMMDAIREIYGAPRFEMPARIEIPAAIAVPEAAAKPAGATDQQVDAALAAAWENERAAVNRAAENYLSKIYAAPPPVVSAPAATAPPASSTTPPVTPPPAPAVVAPPATVAPPPAALPPAVVAAVQEAAKEPDLPKAKARLKAVLDEEVNPGDLVDSDANGMTKAKVVEVNVKTGLITVIDPENGWDVELNKGEYRLSRLKLGGQGWEGAGPVTGERKTSRAFAQTVAQRSDIAALLPGRTYWSGVRAEDDGVAAAWVADAVSRGDLITGAETLLHDPGVRLTGPQRISAMAQYSEMLGALENQPARPGEALQTATLGVLLRDTRKRLLDKLADDASLTGQNLNAFAAARNIMAPWYAARSYKDAVLAAARQGLNEAPVGDALAIINGARTRAAIAAVNKNNRLRKALTQRLARELNLPESAGQTLFDFMEDTAALAAELGEVDGQKAWADSTRVKELPGKLGDKLARALAQSILGDKATPDTIDLLARRVQSVVSAQIQARLAGLNQADPVNAPTSEAIANLIADVAATPLMTETYRRALKDIAGKEPPADADAKTKAQWAAVQATLEGTEFAPDMLDSATKVLRKMLPLSEMLKMHLADNQASIANLADTIAGMSGLDQASAQAIAAALAASYNVESRKMLAEYRKQYIKRHAVKDARLTESLTTGERILQLMNLGAFSDEEFYNAAADELDLPAYDPAAVKELEDMGMQVQRLPEGSAQRNDAMQSLLARVADAVVRTAAHPGRKRYFSTSLPVSIFKSAILSGIGTQEVNLVWGSVMSAMDNASQGLAYAIANRGKGVGSAMTNTMRQLLWAFDPQTRSQVTTEARRGFFTGRTASSSEAAGDISTLERPVPLPGGRVLEQFKWTGRVMMTIDAAVGVPAMLARQRMAARYAFTRAGKDGAELDQLMASTFNPVQEVVDRINTQVDAEESAGQFALSPRPDLLKESRRNQLFNEHRTALVEEHGDLGGMTLRQVGDDAAAMANLGMQPRGIVAYMLEGLFGKANKSALGLLTTQVMPFPRSLANLMEFATNFTPGLGALRAMNWSPSSWVELPEKFRRDKIEFDSPEFWKLAVQQVAGTVALGSMVMLYLAGLKAEDEGEEPWFMVYGNTGDAEEKRQRMAVQPNWKPNSVKIGGLYFGLQDIPGFNLMLGGVAFHHDYVTETQGKHIDPATYAALLATGMIRSVTSRSMLQGMQSMFDLMDNSSSTVDVNPLRALGKLTLGAVGAATNPRIFRDLRQMGEGIASGGRFAKLDEWSLKGMFSAMIPFSPLADRMKNALGEDVTEAWFAPATKRLFSAGVVPPHPVFSPLAAENVFVRPPSPTTTLRLPGQKKPVAISNFKAKEMQDTFHAHYASVMRARLTPAMVAQIATLAKTRGADVAQAYLDKQIRTPAIEFAKRRFMAQDYKRLQYNPFK
jgi:hypothetical protein